MQSKPHQNLFKEPLNKNDLDYRAVYTSCFPMIRSMVLKNAGSIDDARDIFQESIIVLFQNNTKEKFQLEVSTCTYLYSIARNKWLKHIRDHRRHVGLDDSHDYSDEKPLYEDDIMEQRQRLLIKHLSHLGEKCQMIIKHFFEGIPGEQVAKEMEFSSYEYYRVAKNRCTENLKRLMQQDPMFKELKS
jgi:RNA polymerase sigma factor (sigma-70 family)